MRGRQNGPLDPVSLGNNPVCPLGNRVLGLFEPPAANSAVYGSAASWCNGGYGWTGVAVASDLRDRLAVAGRRPLLETLARRRPGGASAPLIAAAPVFVAAPSARETVTAAG